MQRSLVGVLFSLVLVTGEVTHADSELDVDAVCPNKLLQGATNSVTMHVRNRSNISQTIRRFAISYVGNVPGTGLVISGPFVRTVSPAVTLAPGAEQRLPLNFPSVPTSFPVNRVITAVGAVFTNDGRQGAGGILGTGNCLAQVGAAP